MWFLSSSTLFTCYVKAYSSIKGRLRHLPPSSSLIVALALRQLGFNAMNSLFHLLSVTLARFQELQVNLNATAPPIQLPVFSQTGIYCTRARARMNTRTRARAHTHTHTHTRGLRSFGIWRCRTGWLVHASGPHIHSITPVTFLATYTPPEVTTCTLTL